MRVPDLADWIRYLRQEIQAGLQVPGGRGAGSQVTLELAVTAEVDPEGRPVVRPVTDWGGNGAGGTSTHRVTVQFDLGPAGDRAAVAGSLKGAASGTSAEEPTRGGDRATLRRRLELILGGPPGFTTGAKAEILADLLREFGRGTLLEEIQREWVRHFDIGAESSSGVSPG
ncbi:MAG: hypothetical protein KF833_22320 [Verrucomicrobiae bacterium]|nr:hypothetical protein [Verrucomicrobiae bacterium]